MKVRRILRVLVFALMVGLAAMLFGFVVKWLWNWLMPAIFGLQMIGYWQAVGLLILSKILFSSFHARPSSHGDWRARFKRRWDQMTPEERDKFRAGFRGGCEPEGPSPAAPKV